MYFRALETPYAGSTRFEDFPWQHNSLTGAVPQCDPIRKFQSRYSEYFTLRGVSFFDREIFPEMRDLLDEIDPVVRAIGYARELTMDVRGALRDQGVR